MITVTFKMDKDGSVEPLLKRKLREFCNEEFGQEPVLLQTHVTGSGSVQKRYRCLLCGRDKFTSKTPHKCAGTGGNIRKRGLKWEEVE